MSAPNYKNSDAYNFNLRVVAVTSRLSVIAATAFVILSIYGDAPFLLSVALLSWEVCVGSAVLAGLICLVVGVVSTFRADMAIAAKIDTIRTSGKHDVHGLGCQSCGRSFADLVAESEEDGGGSGLYIARDALICENCADALNVPASWRRGFVTIESTREAS